MRKFTGIKAAAGESKNLYGLNGRLQINYDLEKDRVWTDYFPDNNSWAEYNNENIISFFVREPITMDGIQTAIRERIAENEEYEAEMKNEDAYNREYVRKEKERIARLIKDGKEL